MHELNNRNLTNIYMHRRHLFPGARYYFMTGLILKIHSLTKYPYKMLST